MSTDLSREEVWAIQVAGAERVGAVIPTRMTAELEADLRALMGDEVVDKLKREEDEAACSTQAP